MPLLHSHQIKSFCHKLQKEIVKTGGEISQIGNRKKQTTKLSLKKNRIDKPLAKLRKKEKTQITKISNGSGGITIKSTKIKSLVRVHCEQLYINKLNNLDKIDKVIETQNMPTLNYEEIEHLNRPITSEETDQSSKSPDKEKPWT